MAMLCKDEYPKINIDKVIKMCLLHDLGEAVTGDIPAFLKTSQDELDEDNAVRHLLQTLPLSYQTELNDLFSEMRELQSDESKLFKSLDNMEALISHNEAPLSTWLENEFSDNLTYGCHNVQWSEWTIRLKEEIKRQSIYKIQHEPK